MCTVHKTCLSLAAKVCVIYLTCLYEGKGSFMTAGDFFHEMMF